VRQGHPDAGIPRLQRLTALAPRWAQAHHALGTALMRAGRREEGARSLARFAELDQLQRDLDQAWRTMQREPRSPGPRCRAARALAQLDQVDAARQMLLQALALDPHHAEARRDLAVLMASGPGAFGRAAGAEASTR
jgi:Flp pilus assembly protein TadD